MNRDGPSTVIELLQQRAAEQPDKIAFRFLRNGDSEKESDIVSFDYRRLERSARALAARLQRRTSRGERALLVLPPGLDFLTAYFGSIFAGAIAVPLVPPRPNRALNGFLSVVHDCRPFAVLTTRAIAETLQPRIDANREGSRPMTWIALDDLEPDEPGDWREPEIATGSPAMIQYTSGSTASPKGVVVTHQNLLINSRLIQQGIGASSETGGAFWLPPYHDMGLIGGLLQTVYSGATTTLFSPFAFLQRPIRWLKAIANFGAAVSGGPNFAYELCARTIQQDACEGLDLSRWNVALISAEPIQAATLSRFAEAFAPYGFRPEAFYPCYGLAESTLFVTGGDHRALPRVGVFARTAFEHRRVERSPGTNPNESQILVGSGHVPETVELKIVDPETRLECPPGTIGEVWVSGLSVASGYWEHPEETLDVFKASMANDLTSKYLRTGDLGFLDDGELYINGRLKALIIIRGRNLYPQDIEHAAHESHPALQQGGIAAAFPLEFNGEERLGLFAEVDRRCSGKDHPAIVSAVRQAIAERFEVQAYAVGLLRTGTLPRTSSGKVRREACRQLYLSGTSEAVYLAVDPAPAA